MAKKYKGMTEEEIKSALSSYVSSAVRFDNSTLSKERLEVAEYYDGDKPSPSHKGNSKYTSLDVYDTVEGLKSQILEVFAGDNTLGSFEPQGAEDVRPAKIASAYTNFVFYRQNDGYGIIQDVVHDGVTSRNGIAKAVWLEDYDTVEEEFEEIDLMTLYTVITEESVELREVYEHEDAPGTYFGSIYRHVDNSRVDISVVAPDEFIISERCKNADSADFMAHRQKLSKSDLLDQGYDKTIVNSIEVGTDTEELDTDAETLQRFDDSLGDHAIRDEAFSQEQSTKFWVYECYVRIDPDGTGRVRLHQVVLAGDKILSMEEVERHPFFFFVPIPKPHSFWGSNFAKKIIATQNAKTVLTRGILDHTVVTNNPRYEVVKGTLMNPRELMDNRMGGIVNVNRPQGVTPLMQSPLNPFVFQTIGLLDADLEDTSGVSKMSQGLNKDAISKQNSAEMVGQLTSLSQTRQKVIARNLAEQFLKPLMIHIHNLVLENETKKNVIEIAGDWVDIDVSEWKTRKDFTIELCLGYGEKEKEAAKWFQLDQQLTADPTAQAMYTTEKKFNTLSKAFDALGVKDISNYLTPPDQIPPPKPDPMVVAEMKFREREIAIREKEAEIALMKAQVTLMDTQAKHGMEVQKLKTDTSFRIDEAERKDRIEDHREYIAEEELKIAKAAPEESVRAIASPS